MSKSIKPNISNIKLKGTAKNSSVVANITNDVIQHITQNFPNYHSLKNDVEFIEAILTVVYEALENSNSNSDPTDVVNEIFKRLFNPSEADLNFLNSTVDYFINNNIVGPNSFISKGFKFF